MNLFTRGETLNARRHRHCLAAAPRAKSIRDQRARLAAVFLDNL